MTLTARSKWNMFNDPSAMGICFSQQLDTPTRTQKNEEEKGSVRTLIPAIDVEFESFSSL